MSRGDRALKADPNFASSYEDQGLARTALGDNQGALKAFQQAVDQIV